MKTSTLLTTILLAVVLSGCIQTRYITEKYIKNSIENHKEGEFSTIKTYTIFKGASYRSGSYVELTGYRYANSKALVIGADNYYLASQKFRVGQTIIGDVIYIELNLSQCGAILNNYKILQEKIKKEKPKMSEEIYHDFTVSEDLFISYRKSAGSSSVTYIDLWINGAKYSIPTSKMMNDLDKFMKY